MWRRLEMTSRSLAPALLTLLLVFLSAVPKRITLAAEFVPLMAVIAIYYWSLFRPSSMPFWFVFLLGLVQDALFGYPLGLSAFIYVLLRLGVASQRRNFSRAVFWAVWFGFTALSLGAFFLYWVLLSAFHDGIRPIGAAGLQWMLTVALYPVFHHFFNKIYVTLPAPSS